MRSHRKRYAPRGYGWREQEATTEFNVPERGVLPRGIVISFCRVNGARGKSNAAPCLEQLNQNREAGATGVVFKRSQCSRESQRPAITSPLAHYLLVREASCVVAARDTLEELL